MQPWCRRAVRAPHLRRAHGAVGGAALEPVAVDLGELELSCERGAPASPAGDPPAAITLVPCHGDLVAALRNRAGEFQGALTAGFAQLLSDIIVGRFTAAGPADLVIRGVDPSVASTETRARLHLQLDTVVAAPH